jgi:hypothetical protein
MNYNEDLINKERDNMIDYIGSLELQLQELSNEKFNYFLPKVEELEKQNEELFNVLIIRLKTECDLNNCDNCVDLPIDAHTSCLTKEGRKFIEKITNKSWEELTNDS